MLKKTIPFTTISNKNLAIITSLVFLTAASSCKKTDISTSTKPNTAMSATMSSEFEMRALDMSEPELYLYPEDANMERIDMARYALGKALKDVLTPEMIELFKTEAGKRTNNSLLFSAMLELSPELADQLEQTLSVQSLPDCPYELNSYQKIREALYDDNDTYEPELYFYNLATAKSSSSFILSPSLEIEDENGFEDQVMAWYKDDRSNVTEIRLNEMEAKLSDKIIGTIGLHGNGSVWTPGGGTTPVGPTPTLYKTISMQQVNIHFRYEKHGKSEVYAYGVQGGGSNWLKSFSTFPGDFSRHLVSTKKTWEWVNCDENKLLFDVGENVIWNTFERDWYQPWQPVSTFNGATQQTAWVPMTFGNEWYALAPNSNSISGTRSLRNGSTLKDAILTNGGNWTYFQGDNNKFECYFNAQQ